jgi:hypothetical protein
LAADRQRVLSSFSKDKKPPFSQIGLAIPERDKLQMKVSSRKKISFSWTQAEQIAGYVGKMETPKSQLFVEVNWAWVRVGVVSSSCGILQPTTGDFFCDFRRLTRSLAVQRICKLLHELSTPRGYGRGQGTHIRPMRRHIVFKFVRDD